MWEKVHIPAISLENRILPILGKITVYFTQWKENAHLKTVFREIINYTDFRQNGSVFI